MSAVGDFTPALRVIPVDDRGRANIGSVVSAAKGGRYAASVNGAGQILLTPVTDSHSDTRSDSRSDSHPSVKAGTSAQGRAVE